MIGRIIALPFFIVGMTLLWVSWVICGDEDESFKEYYGKTQL